MASHDETFEAMIAGLKAVGVSQSEIARRAGVSRTTIWRYETGTSRRVPFEAGTRIKNFAIERGAVSPLKRDF